MKGSDERDRSVERLLRQSLSAPQPGATDPCLDAETLAAWMDGGLSGSALESALAHVADCARCQSVVGAVVRTDAAAPQPGPAPRRRLTWLVPLTAAAAAVALWFAVPRDTSVPVSQVAEVQRQAPEAKASAPASLDNQPQAPATVQKAPAIQAKSDQTKINQAQASELRKDANRVETDRLKQESGQVGEVSSLASADRSAAAPAGTAPLAAPAAPPAFEAQSASRVAGRGGITIVSPDPSIRWRLVGTVIEQSTNGGSRWDEVFTGAAPEFTAGVAPSASVCWVVGRGGVVLLSTDGRNFSRIAFPEMTDLSAVRASDARSALVSTIDGRTFSTSDGGVTWDRR